MSRLIDAKELYLKLGLSKSQWTRWYKANIIRNTFFKENIDWIGVQPHVESPLGGRPSMDFKISIDFALYLINSAKTCSEQIKMYIINKLGLNNKIDILSRKEMGFLDLLEKILKPFNYKCIRQYLVCNKFRIDLYISNLKLAIEYDENSHEDYTYNQQESRQKEIEQKLGCKFVRVNDSKTNEYNVGLVMKAIYDLKINKQFDMIV